VAAAGALAVAAAALAPQEVGRLLAEDRWLRWQAEQAGTHRGPTIATVLVTFAAVALLLLAVCGYWATPNARAEMRVERRATACADLRRLESFGVRAGSNHRQLERACGASPGR
jgi:hypothetical protein